MSENGFKPVADFVVPQFYPADLLDNFSAPADKVPAEQGGVGGDQQSCSLLPSRPANESKHQQGSAPRRNARTFDQLGDQSAQHCANFHAAVELQKILYHLSPA